MAYRIEIDRDGATQILPALTLRLAYRTARRAARNGAAWVGIYTSGTNALHLAFEG